MQLVKWAGLLTVICLMSWPANAQSLKQERTERRVAVLMERLRDEMWEYRQELNFFQRAPEFPTLVELRYQLRDLAVRVAQMEEQGPQAYPAQRELGRTMEQTARELRRLTGLLEHRTDHGTPQEVRRVADRLKMHANQIVRTIDRLHDLVR